MRAITYKGRKIEIAEVPKPTPGPGQLLVRTLACAVCASDHHYVDHPDMNAADKSGTRIDAPDCDVIMGHEFCVEIIDYGPDCQKTLPIGTRATSIPVLMAPDKPARIVGYSPEPFIGETIDLDELPDAFERARSSSGPLRIV